MRMRHSCVFISFVCASSFDIRIPVLSPSPYARDRNQNILYLKKTAIGSITATHIYIPTRDGLPCKNIVHDEQKTNNSKEKVTLLCCVIITWFSFPYQTNWNWLIGPVDHFITYLEIEPKIESAIAMLPNCFAWLTSVSVKCFGKPKMMILLLTVWVR